MNGSDNFHTATTARPAQHMSVTGYDAVKTPLRIDRVASDDPVSRGYRGARLLDFIPARQQRPATMTPASAVHILAAVSGKTMGLISLTTAKVAEWATTDKQPLDIHPEDVGTLEAACEALRDGVEPVYVNLRISTHDRSNWNRVRVRIAFAATDPEPMGMFEITPLSGPISRPRFGF
jgi:hypothetical protein